jgi:hypothetical protein
VDVESVDWGGWVGREGKIVRRVCVLLVGILELGVVSDAGAVIELRDGGPSYTSFRR